MEVFLDVCFYFILKNEFQWRAHEMQDLLCLQLLQRRSGGVNARSRAGIPTLCHLSGHQRDKLDARLISKCTYPRKQPLDSDE